MHSLKFVWKLTAQICLANVKLFVWGPVDFTFFLPNYIGDPLIFLHFCYLRKSRYISDYLFGQKIYQADRIYNFPQNFWPFSYAADHAPVWCEDRVQLRRHSVPDGRHRRPPTDDLPGSSAASQPYIRQGDDYDARCCCLTSMRKVEAFLTTLVRVKAHNCCSHWQPVNHF